MKVKIIQHSARWVVGESEIRCPDCSHLIRDHEFYSGAVLVELRNEYTSKVIGQTAKWECSKCRCRFECSREFEKDK